MSNYNHRAITVPEPELVIDKNGIKQWFLNGVHHREDGPAILTKYYRGWYQNGKIHRDGGPAVEWLESGLNEWYQNGKLHREDGPAAEYADGHREWWLNGRMYPFDEYVDKMFPENTPERLMFLLRWK